MPLDEIELVPDNELTNGEKIEILTDVMKHHSNIMAALETRISQLNTRITELESRIGKKEFGLMREENETEE